MSDEKPEKRYGADRLILAAVAAAPPAVQALLRTVGEVADRMGLAAYAVGGFVRELLLSRPTLDIDIVVEGDGLSYARQLGAALHADVAEVPRFGTAHLYLPANLPDLPARVDVATARRDLYEHAAALPVVEQAGLREDLYRRDFSINAMAVRLGAGGPGGLTDCFGGLADLRAGQVRILHPLSFVDDPTRILRAVRFAQRYGFRLEPETWERARSAVAQGVLDRVSIERLRNELLLILQEPRSGSALRSLGDLGVLPRLLPGVSLTEELVERLDRSDLPAGELPELAAGASLWLTKLMLLLHGLPLTEGQELATRLKLKREHTEPIRHSLARWQAALEALQAPRTTPGAVVHALAGWSPEGLLLLCLLGAGELVSRYWRDWRHVRLAITGADLIRAGVPVGPAIGRALARVLADRLDGRAPDRASQLALALRYAHEEA